jgi:3-phytase
MLACKASGKNNDEIENPPFVFATAWAETTPVPQNPLNDAADDPAIWVNSSNPDSSRIIGTDKLGGLAVYDLKGHQLHYYPIGKMNNIDIRYGFTVSGDAFDILAVSNRSDQTINVIKINRDGSLDIAGKISLQSGVDEVYGLCMYKSNANGKYYVFVNGLNAKVEQWELYSENGSINGKIVRNIQMNSQVEGMVADDENGFIYISEEDVGIWKFSAEPDQPESKELLKYSMINSNSNISADIEGLAICKGANNTGYLIASSQGNSSYAVFERNAPNTFLGSFKIIDGPNSDGTDETDGLDVTSCSLGKEFPNGLLVIQDGINMDGQIRVAQNFKLIKWDFILDKLNLSSTKKSKD